MKDNCDNYLNIKYIVIHCSDTTFDLKNAFDIHKLHLSFGWDGIGYHKVVKRNGIVEEGRPEYWPGAHVFGHNNNSLGVCLIGKSFFTKKQMKTLKKIIVKWKKKYINAIVLGHKDFANTKKTCPNFDVNVWCKEEDIS